MQRPFKKNLGFDYTMMKYNSFIVRKALPKKILCCWQCFCRKSKYIGFLIHLHKSKALNKTSILHCIRSNARRLAVPLNKIKTISINGTANNSVQLTENAIVIENSLCHKTGGK